MNNRTVFWLLALVPLGVAVALVGFGIWRLPEVILDPELRARVIGYTVFGGFALAVAIAVVWVYLDRVCFLCLRALERGVRIISHSNPGHELEIPPSHLLGQLPAMLHELGGSLHKARREVADALAAGAREIEEQKSQLEAVLRELSEGVLVCDAEARILLYNPAALRLLPNADKLGLGRSLYKLWHRAPLENTLSLLRHRQDTAGDGRQAIGDAEFVCSTVDDDVLLHCRMSLLPATSALASAFIVTFSDITGRFAHPARERSALKTTLDDLRSPLANLRAAADSINLVGEMEPAQREMFQRIIADESATLSARLDSLSRELRALFTTQWPLHDIFSADLLEGVVHRLEQRGGPPVAIAGESLWLHVDSQSIMLLIEYLVDQLAAYSDRFEIECLLGDRRVYVDIVWPGKPVPAERIDAWLDQSLQDLVGAATVAEVLRRHNSELWSQAHRRQSFSMLRLPLPASPRQWRAPREIIPERPEFYDFSITRNAAELGKLAERPLASFSYVVFDTETTGLEPSKGDEIIQIAGVRIVNLRILSGERFDRLVNPGRPIPRASIRIHGITDEQVKDQPPIQTVLPQFKSFVGEDDTILVAHNAAFDMKCLEVKEASTGVTFPNPVLDTLLLSAFLHDHAADHNLDAIAERLGIAVHDRHNAMGDTLVTAQVFVKLLELLRAQGIETLGQAMQAEEKMVRLRKMMQGRF